MKLFLDDKLNKEFFEKGYVKIKLFSEKQIDEILNFYFLEVEYFQKNSVNESFHMTSNTSGYEIKKKINDFLNDYYSKELEKYITNFKLAFSGYFVKEPSENSKVPAHFDWSFVDESKYFSFNAWVCTEDTNCYNGNMQFIQGSHLFNKTLRVTPWRPHYFNDYQNKLENYYVDVPTKAGECLIFHHSLIHASRVNKSKKPRVSSVSVGYQNIAQLQYFHWDEGASNDKVERYLMTTDAFLKLEKNKKPDKELFDKYVTYDIKDLCYVDFKKLAQKRQPFLNKLKNKWYNFLDK